MLEEIYLIRHAEPDRRSGIAYHTPPGPPLTRHGIAEAQAAAAWLLDRPPLCLVSSPFVRTRTTAEIIAGQIERPLRIDERLREGAVGERREAIRERIADCLATLARGADPSVGLVTHGICILTVLELTTDGRIDLRGHVYDSGNHAPTAGIWHGVRAGEAWQWQLAFRPPPATP
jgi:2,3-bisphosphoglycerate-dependent phosphoglycerate mutase